MPIYIKPKKIMKPNPPLTQPTFRKKTISTNINLLTNPWVSRLPEFLFWKSGAIWYLQIVQTFLTVA